jgi:hypothetical protein
MEAWLFDRRDTKPVPINIQTTETGSACGTVGNILMWRAVVSWIGLVALMVAITR